MVQQVSNRLAAEKSPYLLQHKDNPVHWFPWGAEALKRAQEEDKPVFLSIGYSTCHWCHVMAEESFENQKAAEILNNAFISIKVDREERPDVDQLYMASAMAITGQGGWPLSIFMFPDGRPFYCATYIPLLSSPGRTGFIQLLELIENAWEQNRSELKKTADAVVGVLKSPHREPADATAQELVDGAFQALKRNFDAIHGGFGQAPKFPRPAVYSFLLEYAKQQDNAHASEMVLTTLRKMAEGGMRDHLGGGFHRYSVDGKWRVPHFEKMLYDQAQLTHAYLDAFETTKDPFYARVADETLRYTLDCLTSPEGGFYSAEDADSDDPYDPSRHGEGCYYLWKEEEIVKRIGAEQGNVFNFVFGVEFDGNALSDPHGDFVDKNVLYQNRSIEQAAAHFNTSEEKVAAILDQAKKELSSQRNKRTRPHLDDKIITSWNGMMIGAMARGGKLLQKELYIDAAWRAARFIQTTLYDEHTGQLLRRYRDGEAGLQGQLDDYVHCSAGLTQLYLVSQDTSLLNWAEELTQKQFELFWSKLHDCFFDSAADDTLVLRLFSDFDGAEPAPNSVALLNLLILGTLCTRAEWLEAAGKITQAFSRQMQSAPTALPLMLYGLLLSESP